jgi:hypothetical protein
MNKKILYALVVGCITLLHIKSVGKDCEPCDCRVTNQTFYVDRPVYQLNTPERLSLFYRNGTRYCEDNWIQFTVLGGRSTKPERLAKYFFPDCKQQLTVNEAPGVPGTDIFAQELNIYTVNGVDGELGSAFSSIIQICPRSTFVGVGITYKQEIAQFCDDRALWFTLSAPIIQIKNEMRLSEHIIENGGGVSPDVPGAVGSATEAFRQPAWLFGKINDNDCNMKKTRMGDLEFLLGYQLVHNECCMLDSYAGVLFPTGNRACGKLLFEPVVGFNKHYGALFGSSALITIWNGSEDRSLQWAVDVSGQYLFKRTEIRSVPLKNKPFSQYMQTYRNAEQAQAAADEADPLIALSLNTPGINLFTLPLVIKPGFSRTINTALVYNHCRFQGEIGYNFYARQAECAEFACRFNESAALKAFTGQGVTNSVQQIGNNYGGVNDLLLQDYPENIITASQLNLNLAAAPAMLSHTLYGSMGYHWDDRTYPTLFGYGASYEFSGDNTGMNRWMVWGKAGISF